MPHGNLKGNAMKTVAYPVSGDAADWVLGKQEILAATFELGTDNPLTQNFFVTDRAALMEIINTNSPWMI